MKRYNIFQALFMSFYSQDLYRDVARNWNGLTFVYLFMVLFLAWIFPTYQLQVALSEGYKHTSNKIVSQVPVITIKEGKISTPENRPYIITDPDTQEKIVMIDTTGQYTSLEQSKTPLLVTQNAVMSQSNANEVRTYQIPANVDMVINPETVSNYLQDYVHYVWIPLFILFLIGSYVYRVLQSLIYALIGMVIASINSVMLTYGQILQITLVALTPVIIFSTIFDFFNIVFPFRGLFYFLLAMAYVWLGIVANKTQAVKE